MRLASPIRSVLITGTTSGLGRALLAYYHRHGIRVIAVNRRQCPELWQEFPGVRLETVDISSKPDVHAFLGSLVREGQCPDLFVLNAGINRPDNFDGLDYDVFTRVMTTNLFGVMSFVGAIHDLALSGKTIAAISSTSNLVPNPAHIGYCVSKAALRESFKLLARKDRANSYRTVVLGPVHTAIMAGYPGPQGLPGKIFDALAVSSDKAAQFCAELFAGTRSFAYYPLGAWIFYELARVLISLAPGLYPGTERTA